MARVVCGAHLRLFAPWTTRLLSQWMLYWWRISDSTTRELFPCTHPARDWTGSKYRFSSLRHDPTGNRTWPTRPLAARLNVLYRSSCVLNSLFHPQYSQNQFHIFLGDSRSTWVERLFWVTLSNAYLAKAVPLVVESGSYCRVIKAEDEQILSVTLK